LIAKYGRDAKLLTWTNEITANCPRKQGRSDSDRCGASWPDLPASSAMSPSARDAERTMPDARRDVSGSTKGE
jgi:hypothetical protein